MQMDQNSTPLPAKLHMHLDPRQNPLLEIELPTPDAIPVTPAGPADDFDLLGQPCQRWQPPRRRDPTSARGNSDAQSVATAPGSLGKRGQRKAGFIGGRECSPECRDPAEPRPRQAIDST